MSVCRNCLKKVDSKFLFCPNCGYPQKEVNLRKCENGHIIFSTYKNCPFCEKIENLSKTVLEANLNYDDKKGKSLEETALEDSLDKTRIEEDMQETKVIDDIEKTKIFSTSQKTEIPSEKNKLPFIAWLVLLDKQGNPVEDLRLRKSKLVIGKSKEADIKIDNKTISNLHAIIYYKAGDFFVDDLNSTNGTFVNNKKIERQVLQDGDLLTLGKIQTKFKRVENYG